MVSKVSAKHILVEHAHEAQDLLKKIESGESFESLAKKYSKCPSGRNGGDLGEFGKGQMVRPFEEAVFALGVGEVTTQPVKTQFGHHLIKREK